MPKRYSITGVLSGFARPDEAEHIADLCDVEYGVGGQPVPVEAPIEPGLLSGRPPNAIETAVRGALTAALRPALDAVALDVESGVTGHVDVRTVGSVDEALHEASPGAPAVLAGRYADAVTARPALRLPGAPTVAVVGPWDSVRIEVDRRPVQAVVLRDGATAKVRATVRVKVIVGDPDGFAVVDE